MIYLYNSETINLYADKLAKYSRKVGFGKKKIERRPICSHLGAVLADSILQAGVNYDNVVKPRVDDIKSKPEYKGTSTLNGLKKFIKKQGTDNFLTWKGKNKIETFDNLIHTLDCYNIKTTEMLYRKLSEDSFRIEISDIKGIGDKTVDYLSCLVGLDRIPIDRRIIDFSLEAGLPKLHYSDLQKIAEKAANILGVGCREYDLWLWKYPKNK